MPCVASSILALRKAIAGRASSLYSREVEADRASGIVVQRPFGTMQNSTKQFLSLLWPEGNTPSGYFVIWETPGKQSWFFNTASAGWREASSAKAVELDQAGSNVYYGVGLQDRDCGRHSRGGKRGVVALPGFPVDIDITGDGHKGTKYPTTLAEALGILAKFTADGGLDPSLIVHSGGGLHAYWLFDKPLVVTDANRAQVADASKAWQARIIAVAESLGFTIDDTSDLSRVLRPAGTHNRKTGEPRPVSVLLVSA